MRRPLIAALIALFLCIVIGALGYFLLVAPKKSTIEKKQKEIEAVENKIQTEKSTYAQLTEIKNRSAEYEARLAALQARIPAEPELPSLIRTIQTVADPGTGAGVPWLSFAPSEVGGGGSGYSTYTFSLATAGFYDDIVDFVYRLERMQRAVVIDSISMAPTTSVLEQTFSANLGLVSAQLSATTFTFGAPPGSAGTAPQTTPQPGSTPSTPSTPTSPSTPSTPSSPTTPTTP